MRDLPRIVAFPVRTQATIGVFHKFKTNSKCVETSFPTGKRKGAVGEEGVQALNKKSLHYGLRGDRNLDQSGPQQTVDVER